MFTHSPTFVICVQLFIFQAVNSQCVNRIVQGPNGPIELLPNQVLLPPGVQYLPGQRQVYISGPNQQQPVILPAPATIPAEFVPQITNPPNVLSGNIQQAVSNLLAGNNFVPNVLPAVPNVLSGNVVVPNVQPGNMIVPNVESYSPVVMHDNSVANSLANALQLLVVSSLLSNTLPVPEPPCYNTGYIPGVNYVYQ